MKKEVLEFVMEQTHALVDAILEKKEELLS